MSTKNISLNGLWSYLTDPEQAYSPDHLPLNGWNGMSIPSNWQMAGLDNYSGVVWFKRTFSWKFPGSDFPVFLQFRGVDYLADVWLNDQYLGNHEGYFQPFELDVHQILKLGDNELLVKVNAPYEEPGPEGWPDKKRLIKGIFNHHDCRPGSGDPKYGQEMGSGGIWNDVSLLACGTARIERLQITSTLLKMGAAVTTTVYVQNYAPRPLHAEITLHLTPYNFDADDQKQTVVTDRWLLPGTNRVTLVHMISDPHLWSTWDYGRPNLYTCRANITCDGLEMDSAEDQFGIRELTATDQWLFHLNGERVFLRGTNVIPIQWLSEYSADKIAQDIKLLRECNINSVRIHAHVEREEFYRACDEAGIIVWADFALQWSYADTEGFKANAISQIRDFVRLLYNRPSIGVWCCHNEPTHNRFTLDPLLVQAVKEEDSTRIVTPASDFLQHTYPGWYEGHWRDYAGLPAAPFINEYGAQALPNLETLETMFDQDTLWPTTQEDWQAWAFRDFQYSPTFNVAQIEKGGSIQEFIDNSQRYQARLLKYATEFYRAHKWQRVNSLYQFMFVECWPSITWAVVDYYRRPKQGYFALKTAFQPVLVSFVALRQRIEITDIMGSVFAIANVRIVNDLHSYFLGANLCFNLKTPDGQEFDLPALLVDVPADSVVEILKPADMLFGESPAIVDAVSAFLKQVHPGDVSVTARLYSALGESLSENQIDLKFVAPIS